MSGADSGGFGAILRAPRTMRFVPLVVIVLLLAGGLVGCVPQSGPISPENTVRATTEPKDAVRFASDEEALAAAVAAYEAYRRIADTISGDGGSDPDRILQTTTPEFGALELKSYAAMREHGLKGVGHSTFDSAVLHEVRFAPNSPEIRVTVVLCDDVSDIDLVNSFGHSVVPSDRINRALMTVEFVQYSRHDSMRIAGRELLEPSTC